MNWAYFGLICLIIVVSVLSDTGNMETVLIKRLMDGYDKHGRPAPNVTDAVHVHFKLELQQIIDVDEQNQLIQLNVWLNFKWNDFRLLWDPANFGGVADVRFPYGYLWRPDVLLFNSVDAEFDTAYHSNMVVYSTGDVVWIPPSITRSSCKIYIKYFPFDDQLCYLKYGSWTFGKRRLTLHVLDSGIDTTEYKTLHNDEWILMGTPVNLDNYDYDGVEYQSFYVNFQLRRRTLYYAFNIIIPSLLITGMSLVGFYLPVEAGEKVALETTVLASICVCFEIVAKVTPPTSESIPLLKCAYKTEEEYDGVVFQDESCEQMLEKDFLEMVLCETQPWVNETANCSCPCGFKLDYNLTCVGGFAACEPMANYTIMYSICYALKPIVAVPARLAKGQEPPPQWPNDTAFFIGEPFVKEGNPECGYKDSFDSGRLISNDCIALLNYTDLFATLCFGYTGHFKGKCKKTRDAKCSAGRIGLEMSIWKFHTLSLSAAIVHVAIFLAKMHVLHE